MKKAVLVSKSKCGRKAQIITLNKAGDKTLTKHVRMSKGAWRCKGGSLYEVSQFLCLWGLTMVCPPSNISNGNLIYSCKISGRYFS